MDVELRPDRVNVSSVTTEVTFMCFSSSISDQFPLWEINSVAYGVTDLPSYYIARGSNLTITTVFENITEVRCAYSVNDLDSGMIVDICSNTGVIMQTTPNGKLVIII